MIDMKPHQQAYQAFKQRLEQKVLDKHVPNELRPYLSFEMYQTILNQALTLVHKNADKFHQRVVRTHIASSAKTPRSFDIVFFNQEYALIVMPNGKNSLGEVMPQDTLSKEEHSKIVRKGFRVDSHDIQELAVSKIVSEDKDDLTQSIKIETDLFKTIKHPNLLTAYPGVMYASHEELKGTFFAEKADQTLCAWSKQPRSYGERIEVFLKVICAVKQLHQSKLVHNDAHDHNILMFNNEPKLMDFELMEKFKRPLELKQKAAQDIESLLCLGWKLIYQINVNSLFDFDPDACPEDFLWYQAPLHSLKALDLDEVLQQKLTIEELEQQVMLDHEAFQKAGILDQQPQTKPLAEPICFSLLMARENGVDFDKEDEVVLTSKLNTFKSMV